MPDLLVSGSEREPRPVLPRLPRRWRRGAAVLLAVAVVAVGAAALARDRAERSAREAASARTDEVHLRGRLRAVSGGEPGLGRLLADVEVTGERRGRLTSVRLEGAGLTTVLAPAPPLPELPGQVLADATIDCGAVPERLPQRASVVLTVVPPSGVEHEQRLTVPPDALRQAALEACDEPDPDAQPRVEVGAQDERLVLYVETVPRSDADLRIEAVTVPGFAVAGLTLPYRLMPDSGGVYGFSLRVADCARARQGQTSVTVRLSADGVASVRVAAPSRTAPQPGAVPVEQLLRRLVAAGC